MNEIAVTFIRNNGEIVTSCRGFGSIQGAKITAFDVSKYEAHVFDVVVVTVDNITVATYEGTLLPPKSVEYYHNESIEDDDPICVCGVYRSEHAGMGCGNFQTAEQWAAEKEFIMSLDDDQYHGIYGRH